MRKINILWTDDEIEALTPHILFLEEKGYEIDTCSNGNDTIDLVRQKGYDLIFLDENMPGLTGIETLRLIREVRTDIPVASCRSRRFLQVSYLYCTTLPRPSQCASAKRTLEERLLI